MNLDQLALKYKSDKGSYGHNYTLYYDMVFNKIKNESLKILEIGIFRGSSLKMWKDYFSKSLIYGIDIKSECKELEEDRIKIYIGDQNDSVFLNNIGKEINSNFDIVIDDGSHMSDHQINTFKILFPSLQSNGYYVIEDLCTSYDKKFIQNSKITALNFCKNLIDDVNFNGKSRGGCKRRTISKLENEKIFLSDYEKYIEYILFFTGLCIIKKV